MAIKQGKSTIKIRAVEMVPRTVRQMKCLKKSLRYHPKQRYLYYSTFSIVFDVWDISDRRSLAKQVRRHWGFGKFMLMVWDKFKKNKKFKKRFRCSTYDCKFYHNGRCKKSPLAKMKVGLNCLRNRKHHPNWRKIVVIEIKPRKDFKHDFEREDIIDYDFKIYLGSQLYRLWFWGRKSSKQQYANTYGNEVGW